MKMEKKERKKKKKRIRNKIIIRTIWLGSLYTAIADNHPYLDPLFKRYFFTLVYCPVWNVL